MMPTHNNVQEYYGEVLTQSADLKTNACCTADAIPKAHREIIAQIEPEVLDKFYGCGTPIPDLVPGMRVLDLGCGTGRDVYIVSKLVGESGHVIGLDMTDQQLAVARKHQDTMMAKFGYSTSNVEFKKGFIEDLASADIEDDSVDLVISNCVINLSPDKPAVFREIMRVLKPGGQLYISDVFSDRRVPESLRQDPVLHGECLSGALYIEDFRRLMNECGVADYRKMSSSPITIDNDEVERRIGHIGFSSITVRAFKIDLEDQCEDYGESVTYLGGLTDADDGFVLDDHHVFSPGVSVRVCGNTADMLSHSVYANYFDFVGDRSVHYGLFDCSDAEPKSGVSTTCC